MANAAIGYNRTRNMKEGFHYLDMRTKILQFLSNVGKFAVDSAIFNSLKAKPSTASNQVHKIVAEELKDAPLSSSLKDKKPEDLKLVMDDQEAEECKNKIQQHHNTSAKSVDGSKPLKKFPGEGAKGLNVMRNDKKRIFIRSRL